MIYSDKDLMEKFDHWLKVNEELIQILEEKLKN